MKRCPEWSRDIRTLRQRDPRSLAEAFPQDHANPIQHYPSARSWLWSDRVIALLLVCVIVAIAIGGL